MVHDGLSDIFNNCHMGITAENVAREYGISRAEQDDFACASQNKAEAAQKAGKFKDEITPVEIPQRKKEAVIFSEDEYIRHGAKVKIYLLCVRLLIKTARLPPVTHRVLMTAPRLWW